MYADPDPGTGNKLTDLNFNENKAIYNHFIPITLRFYFMPNYLSFGSVFSCIFAPFRPPESGSLMGMRIRIQAANECGFGC
jgi:hypothetical protein